MAKKQIIGLLLLVSVTFPSLVQAQAIVTTDPDNQSWDSADNLGVNPTTVQTYGQLGQMGEAHFYRFSISKPVELRVVLETTSRHARLQPRLVVYEPDHLSIGPALPMEQPPNTLAVVYPANSSATHTEGPLRIRLRTRIDRTISLSNQGEHYLAVYNAGNASGRYRMAIRDTDSASGTFGARLKVWWLTNTWFGPESGVLTIPLVLILAALLAWLIVSKVPHPIPAKSSSRRPKRTVRHVHLS